VPRVETYLKLSSDLFVWGIDDQDCFVAQTKKTLSAIIEQNYKQIVELRKEMKKVESMFAMTEKVSAWCKERFRVEELSPIFRDIQKYEQQVEEVKCYYMAEMVVIDCIELKKKLDMHLRSLKKLIFETVDEKMRERNLAVLSRIKTHTQAINRSVHSTSEFVQLSLAIDQLKQTELPSLKTDIDKNIQDTLSLFAL
jgi:hypothetical protein